MATKLKHYILLRKFKKDLIEEITVDKDPARFLYASLIEGYVRGLIDALSLDKSEASNVRTEASEITKAAYEKIDQVCFANRYNEAFDYCKGRLSRTADSDKVLKSASAIEVISLYETGWHCHDSCDFYDEYENLEKKYLKKVK